MTHSFPREATPGRLSAEASSLNLPIHSSSRMKAAGTANFATAMAAGLERARLARYAATAPKSRTSNR